MGSALATILFQPICLNLPFSTSNFLVVKGNPIEKEREYLGIARLVYGFQKHATLQNGKIVRGASLRAFDVLAGNFVAWLVVWLVRTFDVVAGNARKRDPNLISWRWE